MKRRFFLKSLAAVAGIALVPSVASATVVPPGELYVTTIPLHNHGVVQPDGTMRLTNGSHKLPAGTEVYVTNEVVSTNYENWRVRRLVIKATGEDWWFGDVPVFVGRGETVAEWFIPVC